MRRLVRLLAQMRQSDKDLIHVPRISIRNDATTSFLYDLNENTLVFNLGMQEDREKSFARTGIRSANLLLKSVRLANLVQIRGIPMAEGRSVASRWRRASTKWRHKHG
jgi:hypothetical protein